MVPRLRDKIRRHLAANTWSRRVTREHRVVYVVRADRVDFLQARYHY